jgi:hypothetical protein
MSLALYLGSTPDPPSMLKRGTADKQPEDEEEKTKSLIKLLPRLIAKTQTDPARLGAVLELVKLLKVEVYLDLRKTSVSIADLAVPNAQQRSLN